MITGGHFVALWPMLREDIRAALQAGGLGAPIILSSLPDAPQPAPPAGTAMAAPFSFIQGPPGRIVALAIGLRAALPQTPLLLLMSADSVTLGTNHLIHAARRNIGMTLLLLRSDLTRHEPGGGTDRTSWAMPDAQRALESASRPLEWMSALEAALVGRADLRRPGELAQLLAQALATPGFSVIGLTAEDGLSCGVLSRCDWPEHFAAYREWAAPLRRPASAAPVPAPSPAVPRRAVARREVRIAGLGGQGIKLAGSVLSEAAGLFEGLWATQRGDYGSATRGGPSMVDVVLASEPITYPCADHPDVLVLLTQAAADRWAASARQGATVLADPGEVARRPPGALAVPISALAREHTGRPLAAGVVALGCVAALDDAVSLAALGRSLALHVPEAAVPANIAACAAGFAATRAAIEGEAHV